MDRSDKIIFWFSILLVVETFQTWFGLGWYWFDISVATIIATLVLCLSFVARLWVLQNFLIFIYYIKLTNIISMYAAYGKGKFSGNLMLVNQLLILDYSKIVLNIILYIWFIYVFREYVKGWEYKETFIK